MSKFISLKCWPEYFRDVKSGKKTFEFRRDDRAFEVGDLEPCECGGTSRVMTAQKSARFEQGIALGLSKDLAWKRAAKCLGSES